MIGDNFYVNEPLSFVDYSFVVFNQLNRVMVKRSSIHNIVSPENMVFSKVNNARQYYDSVKALYLLVHIRDEEVEELLDLAHTILFNIMNPRIRDSLREDFQKKFLERLEKHHIVVDPSVFWENHYLYAVELIDRALVRIIDLIDDLGLLRKSRKIRAGVVKQ